MEGLATGRLLASTIRVRVAIPVDTIWNRKKPTDDDFGFRIAANPRHSSRLVLCCNNNHESSSPSSSPSSSSSSSSSSEVIRLRRENSELRASLGELSRSLASISAALADVSRAVQLVANAVDCGPGRAPASEVTDAKAQESSAKQEPLPSISSPMESEIQDPVQARLMKQNIIAHNLAYQIQQAFVQARIEGIGKPFQLAAEDFVTFCLEAHAMGIGLKELQLQLILLEGSLTGAFAMRNQRYSNDPVMSEESRVRSSWVRLVYTTLFEVKERRSRVDHVAGDVGKEREQPDPSDSFVKQLVTLAFEQGYDLERLKLEQNVAGPASSGAIKTMRQSTYLVLLTLQKTTNDAV